MAQLSLTEERERRRIATKLHDSIGHALALCKIKLGALRESLSSAGLADPLGEVFDFIEHAIQSPRSLTFELSPPVLHELGFEVAVQWLVERIQRNYGILPHVERDRLSNALDDDIQILLFQSLRELLVNVVKHAQARKARISIHIDSNHMRISVEDDGVGFEPSEIISSVTGIDRLGLFSIHERLTHFQENLEIQSEPDQGMRGASASC